MERGCEATVPIGAAVFVSTLPAVTFTSSSLLGSVAATQSATRGVAAGERAGFAVQRITCVYAITCSLTSILV